MVNGFDYIDGFYHKYFSNFLEYQMVVVGVLLTVLTLVLHRVFYRLMENLLLRGSEEQERSLREFSTAVNKVMKLDELLALYCDFLQRNFPGVTARVFLKNGSTGAFCMKGSTEMALANRDSFEPDHPLIVWLMDHRQAVSYESFCKSKSYRAMWTKEKKRLEELHVEGILPVIAGEELVAVTLISSDGSERKKSPVSTGNMDFLESAAAVFSIALSNAALYEELRRKAQRDPLTNLYNRGYFQENIVKEFGLSRHSQITLMLINLDDFRATINAHKNDLFTYTSTIETRTNEDGVTYAHHIYTVTFVGVNSNVDGESDRIFQYEIEILDRISPERGSL